MTFMKECRYSISNAIALAIALLLPQRYIFICTVVCIIVHLLSSVLLLCRVPKTATYLLSLPIK